MPVEDDSTRFPPGSTGTGDGTVTPSEDPPTGGDPTCRCLFAGSHYLAGSLLVTLSVWECFTLWDTDPTVAGGRLDMTDGIVSGGLPVLPGEGVQALTIATGASAYPAWYLSARVTSVITYSPDGESEAVWRAWWRSFAERFKQIQDRRQVALIDSGTSEGWTIGTFMAATLGADRPNCAKTWEQTPLVAGVDAITLQDSTPAAIVTCKNPLSLTAVGDGDCELRIGGSATTVNAYEDEAVAVEFAAHRGYPPPWSGHIDYGDAQQDEWTITEGTIWSGSHVYADTGTYVARGYQRTESGDVASNTVTVTVLAGPGGPNLAPEIEWTAPAAPGETLWGSATLEVLATDDQGIVRVEFYADDIDLGDVTVSYDGAGHYRAIWDTTTTTNGQYTLRAVVVDTGALTAEATLLCSVGNLLADTTVIWATDAIAAQNSELIRSLLASIEVQRPSTPENTYRLDATINTPGTEIPTVGNLGTEYCMVPLDRRIDLVDPTSPDGLGGSGDGILVQSNTARLALYLTPMLSIVEHHTAGERVVAIVSTRGSTSGLTTPFGSGTLTLAEQDRWARIEAWLAEGTMYALAHEPGNYLYRLSAQNAFELVYDFGEAMKVWAEAAGERTGGTAYTYLGAYGAYLPASGAPLWAAMQDPDDWLAVDMCSFQEQLLVAVNARDGSRGEVLVLDTAVLPDNATDLVDTYYVLPESMPYVIKLAPFSPLSVNCVESERAVLGSAQRLSSGLINATLGSFGTALAGGNLGETRAWFGCTGVTGGLLLEWDGTTLQLVTNEIEEVTALYADVGWWVPSSSTSGEDVTADQYLASLGFGTTGSSTATTNLYANTLWIGTQAGKVYRYNWSTNVLTEELDTGQFSVTDIRRFAFDMSTTDDGFSLAAQGDGYLYVTTDPTGLVYRRNHSTTAATAWSIAHDYDVPSSATAMGLWRSRWFSGAVFFGGPGSLRLGRYDKRDWSRAYEFGGAVGTGLIAFPKNSYKRLFVGTESDGHIEEMSLAEADIATEGVLGVGMIYLETQVAR